MLFELGRSLWQSMGNYNIKDGATKIHFVKGKSMYPFLKAKNILVFKKVPETNLSLGDLIVFGNSQKHNESSFYIVHRLVKKIKTAKGDFLYQAKGDANLDYDEPVAYEDIIGKVFFVEQRDKFGAKKLLELDSWRSKKLNYLLAKNSCCKSITYRFLRYFYHRMRPIIILIKKL